MGRRDRRPGVGAVQVWRPDGQLPQRRPLLHVLPARTLGSDRIHHPTGAGEGARRCHRYLPERRGHRPPSGALMLETNDKWAVARHYVSLETLARATDDPTGYPGR